MKEKLKFPVFAFQNNDNMIYVFFKERDLKSTNTKILDKLGYNGITLTDANGIVYRIKKAYKVKFIGLFGLSLVKKGRQIIVEFEFENEKSILELSDFKQHIIQKIDNNKSFWKASWDIDELKSKIMVCNSFADIANLIK